MVSIHSTCLSSLVSDHSSHNRPNEQKKGTLFLMRNLSFAECRILRSYGFLIMIFYSLLVEIMLKLHLRQNRKKIGAKKDNVSTFRTFDSTPVARKAEIVNNDIIPGFHPSHYVLIRLYHNKRLISNT